VTGWQTAEYDQMGMWPGSDYFGYRYEYATEYVQIMQELWTKGESDFKGKHFTMNDCKLLPMPSEPIKLIGAGQSGPGTQNGLENTSYLKSFFHMVILT